VEGCPADQGLSGTQWHAVHFFVVLFSSRVHPR
jgi:hypothetical protein